MSKPEGSLCGREYYRYLWGSLNYMPVVGEGMTMIDLGGLRVERVF